MFNPFGEDDDDYEMNVFIDRYMKVSFYRAMHVELAQYCYRRSSVCPAVCLCVRL